MRAIDAIRKHKTLYEADHGWDKTTLDALDTAIKALEQPTIEPRKKGRWIPVTKIYKVTEGQFPNTHIEWVDATEPDEIDAVRCSECREVFDFQDARNWCTECGADMREDGEREHEVWRNVHEMS